MKQVCLLLGLLCGINAASGQALILAGDNYLILDGERFSGQKIDFRKADGGWFVTPNDGHGSLTFTGTYEGRALRLDVEWDGKSELHTISADLRNDGKRSGEFLITMPDKAVYDDGLNAAPGDGDEIAIRINTVDDLNVSGEVSGSITQSGKKLRVRGAFHLRRSSAGKSIVNSMYHDCDPVAHDKLIGAQGRSPSECEAKYDLDVRTAISEAVAPVADRFQNEGWQVQSTTDLAPLLLVARGSEKDIFNTVFTVDLRASRSSDTYARYQRSQEEWMQRLKEATESGKQCAALSRQFQDFNHDLYNAVTVTISFSVNNHGASFNNYRRGALVSELPGRICKIQSKYVAARTGGGEESAVDATFLLLGNWSKPVIEKLADNEGERVHTTALLDPSAGHLQAQNILIRIEGNAELANVVIARLDLPKLLALLQH